MHRLVKFFVKNILRPKWVVFTCSDDEQPELGLSIWGVVVSIYKGGELYPTTIVHTRKPDRYEFPSCLRPTNEWRNAK